MPEWFSRLFKGVAGLSDIHNGRYPARDGNGRTIYLPDRRRRPRLPFRGRPSMSGEEFETLSIFIGDVLGLQIRPEDMQMLESRLMNRLRALHMATFLEYSGYLMSERGINNELDNFIDAITTGKTHFWRESDQFDFIIEGGAGKLLKTRQAIRAWSVGCSTGEEPYTIAMALAEHARKFGDFSFRVLGSDISQHSIEKASRAQYEHESTMKLPASLRERYFSREGGKYTISNKLRDKVTFQRINLLDHDYSMQGDMDMAFFRNVSIYFRPEVRERILRSICSRLSPGGLLFIGHSESIGEFDLPLEPLESSIYVRQNS